MQNKSFLWVFVILLTLTVLYSLSFGLVAQRFEKKIYEMAVDSLSGQTFASDAERDSSVKALQGRILRDSADSKVYPVFGHSYNHLKQKELNLGLDLKGGMSITLEVSIPDLLISLSNNNQNAIFRKALVDATEAQKSSGADYITLFENAWKKQNPDPNILWRIFNNIETQEKFKPETPDDKVIAILRSEASTAINSTENIIRKRIDQFGVAQPNVQKQSLSGRILVELPGIEDRERVRKKLKSTANLEFWDCYFNDELGEYMKKASEDLGKKLAPDLYGIAGVPVQDSLITDSTSVAKTDSLTNGGIKPDSLLTKEEIIRKYPLTLLGAAPVMNRTPIIGIAKASDTSAVNRLLRMPEMRNALPLDVRLFWAAKVENNLVPLYCIKDPSMKGKAPLDGKSITDARQDFDPITGEVTVEMTMDSEVGTPVWRQMTKKNASDNKRPIAIVMDNLVYSAPNVNSEIPNGRSVITMGNSKDREKSIQEAADLAGLLEAGSLPAPARIINEEAVGPTLGEENIRAGMFSFFFAFLVTLIYMVFYYAYGGFAAVIALLANLFFLVGALVSIGTSLTLPGIAGIVLTMGMAVDANVLIYERVKEELRLGKAMAQALKEGYSKAYSAILDGNITTLLTGIVLFVIGTGPIRGFATTLIIGIFTTLFTAIIISKLVVYMRYEKKKKVSFANKITERWFTNVHYDFLTKRKVFYAISIIVIGAGIVSISVRGFNQGVDFKGGNSFTVSFAEQVNPDIVREHVSALLVDDNGNPGAPIVQSIGSTGKELKVTTSYLINSTDPNTGDLITEKMNEALSATGLAYKIDSSFRVDSTMSDDFRSQAIWSTIISLIAIGLYIFVRFHKFEYAVGVSVALIHDVLFVLGLFSLLNGFVPFSLEINQVFIASILTVAGYSINDTVVIFDRVREYLKIHRSPEMKKTLNDAINSTLGRTMNTSLTTLLTLVVMFFFGSDDIKGFCFALIMGIIVGTYSSVFVATPLLLDLQKEKKGSANSAQVSGKKIAPSKA
ncbi:MAG: protein translocase subunit SecDF [Crocinitomicaceae bacterium]|nr:protein translocase subunit SecDF [Crocinitomicaceae bacterium]